MLFGNVIAAECSGIGIDTDTCYSCSWFAEEEWSPTTGWKWISSNRHPSISQSGYYQCDDYSACDGRQYSTRLCNYKRCLSESDCQGNDSCVSGSCVCSPTTEVCDGVDNDCDGLIDEDLTDTSGCNQTGACEGSTLTCAGGTWSSQCSILPSTEICDGIDNDCDGEIDEGLLNACGVCGAVPEEICDGLDNDCDGDIDEEFECIQSSLQCTDDGAGGETCVQFCDDSCNIIEVPEDPTAVIDGPYLNYEGVTFNISGICRDVDDGVQSCNWSVPNNCSVSNVSRQSGTQDVNITGNLECSTAGDYSLELDVTDNAGNSITGSTNLTIQAFSENYFDNLNTAPTVPEVNLTKSGDVVGSTLACNASSSDPDTETGQDFWFEYKFYKDGVEIEGINYLDENYQTSTVSGDGRYMCLAAACDGIVCVASELSNEILICPTYYVIDGGECVQDPDTENEKTFVCNEKPENSLWNNVASYEQTREDVSSQWVPADDPVTDYDEETSSTECRFVCETCYEYNSGSGECERDNTQENCETREKSCDPKPSNSVWTTSGTYDQDWNPGSEVWVPENINTEYAETEAMESQPCKYLCEQGFKYENGECVPEETYCELVGMNFTVENAEIKQDEIDLNFEISCDTPEIFADLPTDLNRLDIFDTERSLVDRYPISNVCSTQVLKVQRTLDISEEAVYIARIYFGNEQYNCFEDVSFSALDIASNKDGPGGNSTQNIPDNNFILVLLVLATVSIILLKERQSNN